ncbi:MAG: RHS repeat-associated core domain-containing protein, partial [Verrucomicrobiales bacterium]
MLDFDESTGDGISGAAVTIWIYDPQRGWLDRKEYNNGEGTDYTYTPAGRLETRTWARGVVTSYGYDYAGRQSTVDYSDATPDISYTYTRAGQPDTVADAAGTWDFDYDADLRLDTETLPGGYFGDRVLSRQYEDGSEPNGVPGRAAGYQLLENGTPETTAAYTYDEAGRLETVSDGTDTFTYHYLGDSPNLLERVEGPAHTGHYMYESGRNNVTVAENEETVGTASTVSRFTYRYNELGQRTDRVDEGSVFAQDALYAWSYDDLGQVTAAGRYLGTDPDNPGASVAAQDAEFDYDFIGNRLTSTFGTASQRGYTANALNQYTQVSAFSFPPSHDEDGNMTFDGEGWYFEWNGENRMVEARNYADLMNPTTGAIRLTFTYDYQGRRVEKTVEEYDEQLGAMRTVSEKRFLYDGWNLIATYDSQVSGLNLQVSYLWGSDLGGSMQGAGGVGGLLSVTKNDEPGTPNFYSTYDANGNVSEYLDETGTIAAHYEYSSFGRVIASTGSPDDFAFRFSTKYQDKETDLLYYGFRYYDPETGRWPSRDPIEEEGGLNLYVAVGNNLLNRLDYLGLDDVRVINENEVWYYRENFFGVDKDCYHLGTLVDASGFDLVQMDGKDVSNAGWLDMPLKTLKRLGSADSFDELWNDIRRAQNQASREGGSYMGGAHVADYHWAAEYGPSGTLGSPIRHAAVGFVAKAYAMRVKGVAILAGSVVITGATTAAVPLPAKTIVVIIGAIPAGYGIYEAYKGAKLAE